MLVGAGWPRLQLECLSLRSRLLTQGAFHRSSSNWTSPFAVSDELTHLKSTFQAFTTRIRGHTHSAHSNVAAWMKKDVVPDLITHIKDVEPRTRRASHAMYAWRLRCGAPSNTGSASQVVLCGSSNGGEAGAGERLERLLELGACEDVIVVVFRWHGGVKLGSDRWRCISSVGKEALARGGFLATRENLEEHVQETGSRRRK